MNGQMYTTNILDIALAQGIKKITDVKIRQLRNEAKQTMWEYYSTHKSALPERIREFREDITIELMKGTPVEDVFNSVLEDLGLSRAAA